MRTLVIAPHMDDEAISCGGLIARRLSEGAEVGVLCVYGRVYDYGRHDGTEEEEKDFFAAKKALGFQHHWLGQLREGEPHTVGFYKVLELLEGGISAFKPDELVIPSADDLNQDHRHLNHVCRIALRPINLGFCHRVLEFVALDGRVRQPTYFVALTRSDFLLKLCAINCYQRERRQLPSPRAPENVEAQARVWGAVAGVEYAEGFTPYLQKE
jgi:LmbE family N-acetylglucosaminyl deacetylase